MPKLIIRDTVLFKQVEDVLGYAEAFKQLSITYKDIENSTGDCWNWNEKVGCGFYWSATKQDHKYWADINDCVLQNERLSKGF